METNARPLVLIVDDQKALRETMRLVGKHTGITLVTSSTWEGAIRTIMVKHPQDYFVAFIDHRLQIGVGNGLDLLREIMYIAPDRVVAYIWSGQLDPEVEDQAVAAGAHGAFAKDGRLQRLLTYSNPNSAAVRNLMAARMDHKIPVLLNFRSFREGVVRMLRNVMREGGVPKEERRYPDVFELFCLDLDRFKRVNDTYGHDVGDLAIQAVALSIRKHIRDSDNACRFGGDEFVIWSPGTTTESGERIVGDLKKAVSEVEVLDHAGARVALSASVGSVQIRREELTDPEADFSKLFREADQDLYVAKKARKRRRVSVA